MVFVLILKWTVSEEYFVFVQKARMWCTSRYILLGRDALKKRHFQWGAVDVKWDQIPRENVVFKSSSFFFSFFLSFTYKFRKLGKYLPIKYFLLDLRNVKKTSFKCIKYHYLFYYNQSQTMILPPLLFVISKATLSICCDFKQSHNDNSTAPLLVGRFCKLVIRT